MASWPAPHPRHRFIVVGAGSAGCALVGALAEELEASGGGGIPGDVEIVLVDAGPAPGANPNVAVPVRWTAACRDDAVSKHLRSAPQPQLYHRRVTHFAGRGRGGSSNINAMFHRRGFREDYADWPWPQRDIDAAFDAVDAAMRPQRIPVTPLAEDFAAAAAEVIPERDPKSEPNPSAQADASLSPHPGTTYDALGTVTGFPAAVRREADASLSPHPGTTYDALGTVTGFPAAVRRDGGGEQKNQPDPNPNPNPHLGAPFRRVSPYDAFVAPHLEAEVGTRVHVRVLELQVHTLTLVRDDGEGLRCMGVVGKVPHSGELELLRPLGRGEVVLCGGAFGTPQLLMLSGVGPRDVLEAAGVPLRLDAPAVGAGLREHPFVCVAMLTRRSLAQTLRGEGGLPAAHRSPTGVHAWTLLRAADAPGDTVEVHAIDGGPSPPFATTQLVPDVAAAPPGADALTRAALAAYRVAVRPPLVALVDALCGYGLDLTLDEALVLGLSLGAAAAAVAAVAARWQPVASCGLGAALAAAAIFATAGGGLRRATAPIADALTQSVALGVAVLTPRSTGSVRLDPAKPRGEVVVDNALLRDAGDFAALRAGAAAASAMLGAMPARYLGMEVTPGPVHKPLAFVRQVLGVLGLMPATGADAWGEEGGGGSILGLRSSAALDRFLRLHVQPFYHACGTCACGEAVDADFRVAGVAGLRAADASVFPSIPRAPTAAPAMMLGVLAARKLAAGVPS